MDAKKMGEQAWSLASFPQATPPQRYSLADLLMNETIVPSNNPPRNDVLSALLGAPANWSGVMTRGREDTSLSPLNMAMGLLGGPRAPRVGNTYGALSDLRHSLGVQGGNPAQRAYDASRAETNRVLGVIDDTLAGAAPAPPRPPGTPAPSTDDVLKAIAEALALRR